jgi:hypothetical protein
MSVLSSREAARIGRIGAYARLSRHSATDATAPARAAFLKRFETQVDPGGLLPEGERLRRAAYARRAHFHRLARLSAIARAARKGGAR